MKKILLSIFFLGMVFGSSFAQVFPSHDDRYEEDPYYGDYVHNYTHKIQIALILDVSGSMDGLIEQAKSQLWTVVNSIMFDESLEGYPQIEIALMEYGNSRNYRDGYMRILVPFTSNLDWIADELFSLRIGGNREYGPRAVDLALSRLEWTRSRRDLRLLYIAGNESFHQGYVDYRNVALQARNQDIVVNTIFCGDYYYGQRMGWADAARLANGDYLNIEQNYRPYYSNDLYSDRLYSLNSQLNNTYLPYGRRGNDCYVRQRDLDRRARNYGRGYASQRFITKSTGAYMNPDWDLVDAVATGRVKLENLAEEDLPSEMRGMSLAQRRNFIQDKLTQRKRVQAEMRDLGVKQIKKAQEVSMELETNGPIKSQSSVNKPQSLDQAIIKSTKHQQAVKYKNSPVNQPRPELERKPVQTQPVRPIQPQRETYKKPETYKPSNSSSWPSRNKPQSTPSTNRNVPKPRQTYPAPVKKSTPDRKATPVRRPEPVKKVTPVKTQPRPVRVQQAPKQRVPNPGSTRVNQSSQNSRVKTSTRVQNNTKVKTSPGTKFGVKRNN